MKAVFKIPLITLVFLISLMIFLPKIELYNQLEKTLYKNNILISKEIKEENLFGLSLKTPQIYFHGLQGGSIEYLNLNSLLLFTNLQANKIKIAKRFQNQLPDTIEQIELKHSVFSFNKVHIKVKGKFGIFKGEYLLFQKKLIAKLQPSKVMKTQYPKLLKQFNFIQGEYQYESKF